MPDELNDALRDVIAQAIIVTGHLQAIAQPGHPASIRWRQYVPGDVVEEFIEDLPAWWAAVERLYAAPGVTRDIVKAANRLCRPVTYWRPGSPEYPLDRRNVEFFATAPSREWDEALDRLADILEDRIAESDIAAFGPGHGSGGAEGGATVAQGSHPLRGRAQDALAPTTPSAVAGGDERSNNGKGKAKRRGRPADTDAKADQRVYDAWRTGEHRDYADLANTLNMTRRAVEAAIDRHRKRQKRRAE